MNVGLELVYMTGPAVFVAGDQVTPEGLPASLSGAAPSTFCEGGCELAYSSVAGGAASVATVPATVGKYAFDTAGNMVAFQSGATTTALTGSTVDSGSDGGVTSWGRWTGSATINGAPWSGFQTLPYVIGLPTPIADVTASIARYTYNLVGATAPTDGTNVGKLTSATLTGNFGPRPTVDINMNLSLASYGFTVVATGIPVQTGGPYAPFGGSTTAITGSGCVTGECSAQINGHFMGAGATHAGFAYTLDNTVTAAPIVGAAAFKR